MFNPNETDVLLIVKNKPKWQFGKLNGIGGKIEEKETPLQAMIREFKEETGIECKEWKRVTVMIGEDWEVQVFTTISSKVFDFKTMTDEEVLLIPISELDSYDHISNLRWLIPMCLDSDNINYKVKTF